jgi:hypothetical protein
MKWEKESFINISGTGKFALIIFIISDLKELISTHKSSLKTRVVLHPSNRIPKFQLCESP